MAAPAEQTARYEVVWKAPEKSLMADVVIGETDTEDDAIKLADAYDAPVAGEIVIRHLTPAGQPVGELHVPADLEPEPEDETETTAALAQAADQLAQHLDDPEPGQPEDALFDPAEYESEELALPMVDGHSVAKIGANIQGGIIWLERGNPDDVALVRDLKVGQHVRLLVDAVVGVPKFGYSTDRGGDLDVFYHARNFKATAVVLAVNQPLEEAGS